VLASLPSYGMKIAWYPQYIYEFIDRAIKGFIWKGNSNKGVHLVNWDEVTKPKGHSGLVVRITRNQNITLLGKLVWDLLYPNNQLWVSVVKDGYFLSGNIFLAEECNRSTTWNTLRKALQHLQDGFRMKLGDGETVLWYD